MIRKTVLVGLALTASGLAQGPGQGPARPRAARTIVKSPKAPAAQPPSQAPQVAPQAPPQVVAPPRPEQMTPVPPQVTYQNGQLSIQAQNSTLSSILSAVRARTGARVEMPADTANERAAVQLGPGNPRDVLASLLQGSRYDYIVIGSPTDPDELSEIILTPHAGSSGGAAAQPGGSSQLVMPSIVSGAGRPETNADEDEAAAEPQPPVYQPPPPQPVSGVGQPGPPNPEPGQQGKPIEVKSPEQLLKELQRMQQQQQQQQGRRQPQQE